MELEKVIKNVRRTAYTSLLLGAISTVTGSYISYHAGNQKEVAREIVRQNPQLTLDTSKYDKREHLGTKYIGTGLLVTIGGFAGGMSLVDYLEMRSKRKKKVTS